MNHTAVTSTMNSELPKTWSSTWFKWKRDAREPEMTLEMTPTNEENPIIAAASKTGGGAGPGVRTNQSKAAEAPTDLDPGDHIDIHVVEEGGAAEDESDDEAEGSKNKVSIGGIDWSVNKPSRRSTINAFEQANVGELSGGASQGGQVSPVQLPSGGALAKRRSSASAMDV